MSNEACSIPEAVERLSRSDPALEHIYLTGKKHSDLELAELVDYLLAHPNVITELHLGSNRLRDRTGVKLARYLASSSTIQSLYLQGNWFTLATYLAMATALKVNSSLRILYLSDNHQTDRTLIDAAFVDALILNPIRSTASFWYLYAYTNDYERLKDAADQRGHPSLQAMVSTHFLRKEITA
jgi:hypothetical protein